MAKIKSKDELGEELCDYCPLEEWKKGYTSMHSCEGCRCDEAYQNYLDDEDDDDGFDHMHEVEKCYGYDGEY